MLQGHERREFLEDKVPQGEHIPSIPAILTEVAKAILDRSSLTSSMFLEYKPQEIIPTNEKADITVNHVTQQLCSPPLAQM